MRYIDLVESSVGVEIKPVVLELYEMKKSLPEIGDIPKIASLNDYIEKTIAELKIEIALYKAHQAKGFEKLNGFFLDAIALRK